jgi:hypothetical protein
MVHGIRDIDVADEPTFAQKAASISRFFQGCDITVSEIHTRTNNSAPINAF